MSLESVFIKTIEDLKIQEDAIRSSASNALLSPHTRTEDFRAVIVLLEYLAEFRQHVVSALDQLRSS